MYLYTVVYVYIYVIETIYIYIVEHQHMQTHQSDSFSISFQPGLPGEGDCSNPWCSREKGSCTANMISQLSTLWTIPGSFVNYSSIDCDLQCTDMCTAFGWRWNSTCVDWIVVLSQPDPLPGRSTKRGPWLFWSRCLESTQLSGVSCRAKATSWDSSTWYWSFMQTVWGAWWSFMWRCCFVQPKMAFAAKS